MSTDEGDGGSFNLELTGPSTASGLDLLAAKNREKTKMGGNCNTTEDQP